MDVSKAADLLFKGVIPERTVEMRKAWIQGNDRVRLVPRQGFLCQEAWGVVQVSEVALRQIWLVGYAAWRSVEAYSDWIVDLLGKGPFDLSDSSRQKLHQDTYDQRFDEALNKALEASEALSVNELQWPDNIPYPDENRVPSDPGHKATFDLLCIATAYIFLHEVRHAQIASRGERFASADDEEVECDRYARSMILDEVGRYAHQKNEDEGAVQAKRILGILIAKLVIVAITPRKSWDDSGDHPPVRERLQTALNAADDPMPRLFWAEAAAMVASFARYFGTIHGPIPFTSWRELAYALADTFVPSGATDANSGK
jgi:hypothetical protein